MNRTHTKSLLYFIGVAVICLIFFTDTMYAQTPRLRSTSSLPSGSDSSFTLRLDFRYGQGLQKGQGGSPTRIILPSVQTIMQQFSITDNDVVEFMPNFNEADTIMYHPDGYAYRATNYAHSVKMKCSQASRKAELIGALSLIPQIYYIQELQRPKFTN
jgi:hypothetical protein